MFNSSKTKAGTGDIAVDVVVFEGNNNELGPDSNDMYQLGAVRGSYTAGIATITASSPANPTVFEPVYESDGTTAMTINLNSSSYRTKVIGPIALHTIRFTMASSSGTGDWKAWVGLGKL